MHQFRLDRPGDDGVPLRSKLEQVAAATGKRPPELDGPEFPEAWDHLMTWFLDLGLGRTSSGFGPNPLTWADFQAWSQLTGIVLRPVEVQLLRVLDRAYLKAMAEGH
jgi:hypothetical protein